MIYILDILDITSHLHLKQLQSVVPMNPNDQFPPHRLKPQSNLSQKLHLADAIGAVGAGGWNQQGSRAEKMGVVCKTVQTRNGRDVLAVWEA